MLLNTNRQTCTLSHLQHLNQTPLLPLSDPVWVCVCADITSGGRTGASEAGAPLRTSGGGDAGHRQEPHGKDVAAWVSGIGRVCRATGAPGQGDCWCHEVMAHTWLIPARDSPRTWIWISAHSSIFNGLSAWHFCDTEKKANLKTLVSGYQRGLKYIWWSMRAVITRLKSNILIM